MSKCKYCEIEIAWVTTANNKPMPIEVDPGIVTIIDNQGRVRRGELVHWGRCPGSEQAREDANAKRAQTL